MARDNITLPVSISKSELSVALARELSYEALTSFIRDVDKYVADWGFTKKLHAYFDREMRILAEEEGRPLPKRIPEPFTDAQIGRLFNNSEKLMEELKVSRHIFDTLVKHVERAHGIRGE